MQQRRSHNTIETLADLVSASHISHSVMISMIEDLINMEKLNIESSKLLNDSWGVLHSELRITNAHIMLSVLRMNGPLARTGS
jgi:hypothetical protein